jgi:excinuclease ABC subunit A
VVPVYAGFTPAETRAALKRKLEPSYMGTFTGVKRHVLHTFATTHSALMKKRALRYMLASDCAECHGKRLRRESLAVKFAGLDIAELSQFPLKRLVELLQPYSDETSPDVKRQRVSHPEQAIVTARIAGDLVARLKALLNLGLGYLALDRSTPTLSPGELQRLRLATQLYSNLFGVIYVLDEPSAGLHPADTESLLEALDGLKRAGNSLFVVEHETEVMRHADWLIDVGPAAGQNGGEILYSGPPGGLRRVQQSHTARYLFPAANAAAHRPREPKGWLRLAGVTRNNLNEVDVEFPLGVFTAVTGVSGSGKSTLVSQVLVELMAEFLGHELTTEEDDLDPLERIATSSTSGHIESGGELLGRLVRVDQKAIGRSPRSNMATYTGMFDHIRRLFASTKLARSRRYDAGRFSFNVGKGRCDHCQGEGFVMVELLFLPSVYAPCPTCHGARYNAKTLEVTYCDKNIADVLDLTVDSAWEFFADVPTIHHALTVLRDVGLGYLRLGQPATELSGGEAQRIKLATELQRSQRGRSLYVLDEPTTGLHPADVEKLLTQLNGLVDAGNTVIVVEHDMQVIAHSDWIIDIGPGAGDEGGKVVVAGPPAKVARDRQSRTAPYLRRQFSPVPA